MAPFSQEVEPPQNPGRFKKLKLQENTEEYFKAHGIVQGQPNELRIGGTLFRFPAGVGLNPYTDQETYRSVDGSPMTLSTKEGLEQGKYEKVATQIVQGQADRVAFYLEGDHAFRPSPDPFGTRGSGQSIHIQISSGYKEGVSKDLIVAQKFTLRSERDMKGVGLKEFVFADQKNSGDAHLFYLATNIKTPRGGSLVFHCEPRYDANGYVDEPAHCAITYQALQGFAVTYGFSGDIWLTKWQEMHRAVTRFVDSLVVQ
ncbi:MAG TPA: hypothetical protein PLE48_13690, partial [Thiobacillus sp.]|nr:MAG: hypothetical protein B7Y21_04935 [Hydrogenophilales bacterium 16-61-112]HQT31603.1 hypothetical protein [Thiobacillus sp.]HQT71459.1 hypothetical protein [Thiobacillus sp.]